MIDCYRINVIKIEKKIKIVTIIKFCIKYNSIINRYIYDKFYFFIFYFKKNQ